jgi:N-acetylneuraminic acid mutarotase
MKLHLKWIGRRRPELGFWAILAACLGLGLPPTLASPGSWTRKADLPVARVAAASAEVDGILYVAGGHLTPPYAPATRTLFAYDPKANAWTSKADMPTARVLSAASAVDGLLYVIGGAADVGSMTLVSAVEAYDPKTDSWTKKAAMPTARADIAACTLDGLIYVIGGVNLEGLLSVVEAYDPKTDRWTRKASLPVTAEVPIAQVVNDRMYVFAGNRTFAYDTGTDRWTARADLPADSLKALVSSAGTVNGVVYLFGGLGRPSNCASAAALAYDPVLDRFTKLASMPAPTFAAAYATIGGKIYIAGGASGIAPDCAGAVAYQSLRVYDPQGADVPSGSWNQRADLPAVRIAAAAGEVDGILYVAAGNTAPLLLPQPKTLFAYDPKTDTWTRKADIPTGREMAAASVADGLFYVIGGITGLSPATVANSTEAYDPKTDTWTRKAAMPTARGDVAGCTLDGRIYVVGGYALGEFLSVVECYDPKTDQWSRKADLPVTAEVPVALVVNARMYVFTGNRTFAYDAEADQWTARANLPAGSLKAVASAAGTVDGIAYLFGGLARPSDCASSAALAYDPVQNRYTEKPPMPAPTFGGAGAVIDGKVYLAGGASGILPYCPGAVFFRRLWVYDPQGWVAPNVLSFDFENRTTLRLAWEAEVGREYVVETTTQLGGKPWALFSLSTGLTLVATNTVLEAKGHVSPGEKARFFRVKRVD